MRIGLFSILVLVFLHVPPLSAEIIIRIVNYPEKTLIYSPFYIFGEIENTGPESQAIIVKGIHGGAGFEASSGNNHLDIFVTNGTRIGDKVILLKPGQKYLYEQSSSIGFQEPGIYEIRAILEGSGKCHMDKNDYLLTELPDEEGAQLPLYQCWAGEIGSDIAKVSVTAPVTKEDVDALIYVSGTRFGKMGKMNIAFAESYSFLKQNYPNSYCTVVAGFVNGNWDEILLLQPSHPFVEYLKLRIAIFSMQKSQDETGDEKQALVEKAGELQKSLSPFFKIYFAQWEGENVK